ncbi:MAG TPA: hypothetical protein VKZ79_24430 [Alphaproteobacteria bacterium]|nr:hypothetical protein [Alphaproteobacteria bacterium]
MIAIHHHPHADFDRFPQLVRDLTNEFGPDGITAVVERFIDAEQADFYWEGRIAEMPLGPFYGAFDDEEDAGLGVAILGIFRGRYYVATCVVDAARRVCALVRVRHFGDLSSAESAFLTSG